MTRFLSVLEDIIEEDRGFLDDLSRIVPAHATFNFGSVPEFEEQARQTVLSWAERLAGSSFHVRMRRRGHRGELGSLSEERFLGGVMLEKTAELGRAATIGFADPDFVIDIETVDDLSGLLLWSREERVRFPLLRID